MGFSFDMPAPHVALCLAKNGAAFCSRFHPSASANGVEGQINPRGDVSTSRARGLIVDVAAASVSLLSMPLNMAFISPIPRFSLSAATATAGR